MTLTNSLPTDGQDGLDALETRATLATLVARDATGAPRAGVVPGSTGPLVTGRGAMEYAVAGFRAVTSRTAGGVELIANDGTAIVPTAAAPAANARIDILYTRARFDGEGDGSSTPELAVASGAAALSPADPALPVGALPLARVRIPSGVTATTASGVVIEQIAPYTAAAGGVVGVRSDAELAGWAAADGGRVFHLGRQSALRRSGGTWIPDGSIVVASDVERDAAWGVPATETARLELQNRGPLVVRTDRGNAIETYLATYNASSNPRGRSTAGWYTVAGRGAASELLTVGTTPAPSYASGWSTVSNAYWAGIKIGIRGGLVTINGACQKSSYTGLETVFVLPPEMRPAQGAALSGVYGHTGDYVLVQATGEVKTLISGTGQVTINGVFPL